MVYEQLRKGLRGMSVNAKEISVSRTIITFGIDISKDMLEKGATEIWLDKENNKVGFKPTKDRITGFTTKIKNKAGGTRITAKAACDCIPTGVYEAKREDDMWVIEVLEIASK